jgi:hypothetical protein
LWRVGAGLPCPMRRNCAVVSLMITRERKNGHDTHLE